MPGGPTVTFIEPGTTTVEFSFDRSNPGVMVIYCQLTLNAAASAIPNIENKIRVAIEPVGLVPGGSLLEWWAPNPVPPGGVSLSPWTGSTLGQPPNTHSLMGKARLNTDPTSTAFGTYEVSAIFTGLPDRNDFFGAKTVYAQIVEAGTVLYESNQALEVFHDRIGRTWYIPTPFIFYVDPNPPAYNNPGTGTNYGPNWFYYWKNPANTIDTTGRVVIGSPHDWQYEHDPNYYGYYALGEDHVNVCPWAQWRNDGPEYHTNKYTGAVISIAGLTTDIGPVCCAQVVAHEGLHKAIYETWEPLIMLAESDGEDDGDPMDDPDDDGVPNRYENLGYMRDRDDAVSPGADIILSNPDDPDTYDLAAIYWGYATYGDQEVLCRALEIDITQTCPGLAAGGMSVDPSWDWCNPGTNSTPPYAPGASLWPW
ncbi:MAG: hypothetical protein AMK75_07220 [Planctomycetes bacterium SM23_65]|nr:MAG: hypothetical protein AMK75_07220 [Planctomycetes bacterium SM23_65]